MPGPRRFVPPLALVVASLSLLAACVPQHRVAVAVPGSGARLSVGADSFDDDGPFRIAFAGPTGATTDPHEITVAFSRAMRPVGLLGDAPASDPPPATVVRAHDGGAVPGTWRWFGERTAVFWPSGGFHPATEYRVSISAGLRALDGSTLAETPSFSFTSARPSLSRASYDYDEEKDRHIVALDFDQPIAAGEVTRAVRIEGRGPKGMKVLTYRIAENTDDQRYELDVDRSVATLDDVTVVAAPSLTSTDGPLDAHREIRLRLEEVGALRAEIVCPDGDSDAGDAGEDAHARIVPRRVVRCAASSSPELRLSKDVATRDLARHLVVSPAAPLKIDEQTHGTTTRWLSLSSLMTFDAGRKYRFVLRAGLRAVDKQALAADQVVDVEMSDLPSSLGWRDIGKVAVVESARPAVPLALWGTNVTAFDAVQAPLDEQGLLDLLLGVTPSTAQVRARPGSAALRVSVKAAKNETGAATFALPDALHGPDKTGSLAIATSASGLADDVRVLEITDLGITADWSPRGGLVWVTRLSSGAPVADAKLALRRAWKPEGAGTHVASRDTYETRTDKDGIATIPAQVAATFLDDEREERTAVLVASYGADRAHVALPVLDPHLAHAMGYAFTDRRLYRPGETAFFKATFRAPTPRGLVSLAGRPATIEAVDEEDRALFAGTATLDAFGSCSVAIPIPRTVSLGHVEVRARIGTAPLRRAEVRHRHWHGDEAAWPARTSLVVDEFRTVDFKVEVAADRSAYVRGDTAQIAAHGSYLSGSPMHDVAVPITVQRSPTSFAPPGLEGFATDERALAPATRAAESELPFSSKEPKLGAAGMVTVPLSLAFPQQYGPDAVTVLAAIADVSGAFEAGDSTSFVVHPADLYLGVRPIAEGPIFPGRTLRIELVAAAIDGTPRPGVPVRVDVLRRVEGAEDAPVSGGCALTTARERVSCDLRASTPGLYLAHATALDSRGRHLGAVASFRVEGAPPPPPPRQAPTPPKPDPLPPPPEPMLSFDDACRAPPRKSELEQVVSILAESDMRRVAVKVGETAHLCLRGVGPTLLTIEREGVLHHELRHLDRIGTLVDLPITAEFHPNVRIALHGVQGRTLPFPDPKHPRADVGHPTAHDASIELRVEAPATRLAVSIETEREYRPGAEITARVRVHDAAQRPAQAQVTFWAVDEAIVLLAGFRVPELAEVFGEERGDDVRMMETRDLLFWEHIGGHTVRSPSLRMGAASSNVATHVTRGLFRPTAFFVPNLITGPDGVATVKVRLPDNLTTWNLYAVAMTTGEGFGAAESFFRTNKPLMARPQLPRFLRVGDHVEATVMIDSMSTERIDAKVSMRVTGGLSSGAAKSETSITLPPAGHVPVRFPLDARALGKGTVTFRVEAPGAKLVDEVVVDEEIAAATSLEAVVLGGETTTRTDEPLGDLSRARSDMGGLDFRLATSPLVGLADSLAGLVEYPYGCTEQLTSRLVPLVRLRGLSRELGVPLPPDVDGAARASLASLLTHQRGDGGFGFWAGSARSEPWLTIASLGSLYASRRAGYVVPEEPIERATRYLQTAKAMDGGERALLEDLFASEGRPREKELRALVVLAESDAMPYFGRALVAHALAKVDRALALRVLASVASHVEVTGATAKLTDEPSTNPRATLSSDARTTAMVLRAFVALDPKDVRVTKLVRGLLALRRAGRWTTTQASAWALLALDEARPLYATSAPETSAHLWLDGDEVAKATFTNGARGSVLTGTVPMSRLVAASGGALSFTTEGGPLFFEGTLRYARRELPKTPLEHGIHVAKSMRVLQRAGDPVVSTAYRAGDYVEVDVLLASPVARELVVLDDPIPAGFEAVNQTYANRDTAMIRPDASRAVTHRELRDDRVVTFFDVLPSGEHHTSYVLRVTSPGRFVVPPTKAECMYAPDVFGRTAAAVIEAR
jgi:uncharacterized protein YfaS (alpha-2-macroglobulin family)